MIQKIKSLLYQYRFAVLSSILFLGMELQMQLLTGDEFYYRDLLNESSLLENIIYYYHFWSNRILVDAVAMLVLHMPLLIFKCINAFFFLIGQIAIYKLCLFINEDTCSLPQISLFMFLIPFSSFMDAGFSVTSIYYLWTFVLGLWAIYFAAASKKYWFYYILGPVCTIFSCNMEQISMFVVTVLMIITIYCIKKRESNILCRIENILAICVFGYMLFGPGAKNRVNVAAGKCFPEFGMLSVTQKLDMGFSVTMNRLVFEGDLVWLIMTVIIMVLLYHKAEEIMYKILGCIPFGLSLGFLLTQNVGKTIWGSDALQNGVGEYGVIYLANFDMRCKWILLFLFGSIIVSVFIDFFLLFSFEPMFWNCNLLFLLGLASRIVMGFSPTMYESGTRTYYLFWMCCIFIIMLLIQKLPVQIRNLVISFVFVSVIIQNCSFIYALS